MTLRSLLRASPFALCLAAAGLPIWAQVTAPRITSAYGRSVVEVDVARAQPGGVLAVSVRGGRWSQANSLLDGRRGSLLKSGDRLFGLIPVSLNTEVTPHRLTLFFPGGRRSGGATSLMVPVSSLARPSRLRTLTPEALTAASAQTALGHGRFLLGVIRTRTAQAYQQGPLQPPVDRPIGFPFGGAEDYGMVMGPMKDGLMGEQHRGVDYELPPGTVVKAPGTGIVLLARTLVFSGETVVIGHGGGLVSVLSHLAHVSVREGDVVNQGTAVGTSGKTGLGALTPHLCFSVYLHSLNVDPAALMDPGLFP